MKPELLQLASYASAHQGQLDAEFTVHGIADLDLDPTLSQRIRGIVTRSNVRVDPAVLERLPALETARATAASSA